MLLRTRSGLIDVSRGDYATDRDFYRAVRFFRTR